MEIHKKQVYWAIVIFLIFALIFICDYLLGFWNETARTRKDAKRFRSEVAVLETRTKNVIPKINHIYPNIHRSEGSKYLELETPRMFRTDQRGVILGPSPCQRGIQVLFLGGSTTECNEVDEPFRFPVVAEKNLKTGWDINICSLNGGVRGHTTQDSINSLLNRPGFRKSDIIILMHNINDRLSLISGKGYKARLGKTPPTSAEMVFSALSYAISAIWDCISYRSNGLFLMRTVLGRFNPFAGEKIGAVVNERTLDIKDPELERNRSAFKQNLLIFIRIVQSLGKTPVVMTQPLGRGSSSQLSFNETIREISAQEKITLVDLDRKLPLDREWAFFSDSIHLNNRGSIVVGEIISDHLAKIILGKEEGERSSFQDFVNPLDLAAKCPNPLNSSASLRPGKPKLIVGKPGRYPSFSKDGAKILFLGLDKGLEHLWIFDIRNNSYLDISKQDGGEWNERHPVFYGSDLRKVIFGRRQGMDRHAFERLFIRNIATGNVVPLIKDKSIGGSIPAVGPDDKVFFAGIRHSQRNTPPDLFSYDPNSGELALLTESLWEEWRPAISPDGKTLYFIANPLGDFDIFKMPTTGGKPELVYRSKADEWDPTVSPDGEWLVFASKQQGNWDLYAMRISSKESIRLTNWPEDEWDPSFHPNGNMLLFASSGGSEPNIYGLCLFGDRTSN